MMAVSEEEHQKNLKWANEYRIANERREAAKVADSNAKAKSSSKKRSRSLPSVSIGRSAAEQQVLFSMVGTGVVVFSYRWAEGKYGTPDADSTRTIIGLAVVYLMLGFAADFAPQIAGPFALLVFLTALFRYGPDLFTRIESATGPAATKSKTPKVPTPKKRSRKARKNER